MSDVFLSYAREDVKRVGTLANGLAKEGLDVFWDRRILDGVHFSEVIERNLTEARCVVVFWSKHSVQSRWVKAEASWGDERRALVEVRLDGAMPPLPFGRTQVVDLSRAKGISLSAVERLVRAVKARVHPQVALGELDAPRRGAPVTEDHLVVVHTSWRTPKYDDAWGEEIYEFEVIVYGHDRALDRIESVTWYLHPDYDEETESVVRLDRRSRRCNFRHRELAWGDSVIRASVKVKDQVDLVRLSRYLNLQDKGEPLRGDFY